MKEYDLHLWAIIRKLRMECCVMKVDYKRNLKKCVALAIAIICYFIIHEGAHWLYAMSIGVFKQINIIGIGIQIEPYIENMNNVQLGIFNLVGSIATIAVSYILLALTQKLVSLKSDYARAITYFISIAFLVIDPLYLCVLSLFVGGGDMNGIVLIAPELLVRILAGIIATVNIFIVVKVIVPKYRQVYQKSH
jgi:hypothetical protein